MDLGNLFNSKRRAEVLSALSQTPEGATASEIAAAKGLDPAGVLRELRELEKMGIAHPKTEGRKMAYRLADNETVEALKKLVLATGAEEVWTLFEELPNGYFPYEQCAVVNTKGNREYFAALDMEFDVLKLKAVFRRHENISFIYFNMKDFDAFAEEIVSKTIEIPEKMNAWLDGLVEKSNALRQFCAGAKALNFSKTSNRELGDLLVAGEEKAYRSHLSHWLHNVDFSKKGWTRTLQKLLKEKRPKATAKDVQTAFVVLTTPTDKSLGRQESGALMKLVDKARKNPALRKALEVEPEKLEQSLVQFPEFVTRVDGHVEEFGFLTYGPSGPGNRRRDYLEIISHLVREKKSLPPENKPDTASAVKEFGLTGKEEEAFRFVRRNVWYKGYRKDCLFEWWALADRAFAEIARRKNLSLKQVRMALPCEFRSLPDGNELNRRAGDFVMYNDGRKVIPLSGKDATGFMEKLPVVKTEKKLADEFYGDCACAGIARGKARVVNAREDVGKMESGDILVSYATSPELMAAINKAGAIVTDMGGVTCHAAIVSRELGIPCVIGTNIATKALKDGDIVEVNASHGRVKVISRA